MTVFDLDLDEHRIRLSHGRPVRPGAGPSLRPIEGAARSRREGRSAAATCGAQSPTGTSRIRTAPASCRKISTGKDDQPLRDCRSRTWSSTRCTSAASRSSPSSGVQHPGTFAGLREKIPYLKELGVNCVELMPIFEFDELENGREQPADRRAAVQLLGLQHRRLLRPQGRLRRHRAARHAGRRVQDAGQGAAPQRHRGDARRRVQPHRRGRTSAGPTISFRGLDNQHLLHAHAGGLLLQLQRLRQHAQLQQPGRARLRARLPALLGRRVPHRRLPLRPGEHPRPRSDGRAARQSAAARGAGRRPGAGPDAS